MNNKVRVQTTNKRSKSDGGVAPHFTQLIGALHPCAASAAAGAGACAAAVALAHVGADEAELGAELLVSEAQLLQCVRCNNNNSSEV